ncbi:hypothetical protein [Labrenzia sp. OB1]|uniref:hypothetical protein n=1 Tax=Labrenzia sp. OB1 TaxID=1561204 RepID=UPI0012E6FF2D|nr:hypothetical protein [Labrenzia sp. OB1]
MKISGRLERHFPNLAYWVQRELPEIRGNDRIFNAFKKYSQLSHMQAINALTINNLAPEINFRTMKAYGQYRPALKCNRDKVFLSRSFCREFDGLDPDYRVSKAYDLIMRATLLHEMVHWGDYIVDGTTQPNATVIDPATGKVLHNRDVGFQFEVEAFYGIYTTKYL